jgi:hypothetical protein
MRTFILGLGAQKSATTWLFSQLIKSPDFARGFSKEYHLFDAIHLSSEKRAMSHIVRRINNYPFHDGDNFVEKHERIMLDFYSTPDKYYDYFDSILDEGQFTLDITPSYSGLSSEVLKEIRREFELRGIQLKVVFFLREPICRVESAVKMGLRRSNVLREVSLEVMTQKLRNWINSKDDLLRANYREIVARIDGAFNQEEVYYGFYETLFSASEVHRLSTFLGLPESLIDPGKKVNATPSLFRYTEVDMDDFRDKVADRYEFVSSRFGFDLSIWHRATEAITIGAK